MQRLFNVTKWRRLCEGQTITFPTARPRVVRLELNAPRAVGLYLFEAETGEALFLCRAEGRDTVEFYSGGGFSLVADGEVFIYTADGETVHHEAVDPVIFTRMAERRSIHPEIAAIQRTMNINIERRLAAQRDEFNAAILRMQRDRHMAARAAADQAAVAEPAGVPESVPAASTDGGDADDPPAAGGGKRKRGA